MFNFKVKSIFREYEVSFINDMSDSINTNLKDGDYIILDNKVKTLYWESLKDILSRSKYIGIDATETQKSYDGIIPIIQTLIEGGFKKNHCLIAIGEV